MDMTRRAAVATAACALGAQTQPEWTPDWDRALVQSAVERASRNFDNSELMLRSRVGSEYRYHTTLRSVDVHPTRETLMYALFLLETRRDDPGQRIIDRVLRLQDTDADSKWYGLWSYYLEEPLPKMAPADWNWADFNGSALLLIETRHGRRLDRKLRGRVLEGIRHAAASVRRRNVSMTYTNIAVQGTFVTLAAAELLADRDLKSYASERLRRFCSTVDETGSFAEYNSPTYASVTITNLSRMLATVRDEADLALVRRLYDRAWLHVASHWHAPSRQLAGPISRAYATDIGRPLWIQKALNNRIVWVHREELADVASPGNAEVALLDARVPPRHVPMFLELDAARQHREIFAAAQDGVRPVQGTTWLAPRFALGSVNRGDFWVQRRPLLGWHGSPAKPVRLRFIKDDYDFSSALLYSVQEREYVLGAVLFRTPGGDKHVSLDPLPPEFKAERMQLRLECAGTVVSADDRSAVFQLEADLRLAFAVREASFCGYKGRFTAGTEGATLDLLPPDMHLVRWAEAGAAKVVFTVAMLEGNRQQRQAEAAAWSAERLEWRTPRGALRLRIGRGAAAIAEHDAAFREYLDEQPAPLRRLSEERLIS